MLRRTAPAARPRLLALVAFLLAACSAPRAGTAPPVVAAGHGVRGAELAARVGEAPAAPPAGLDALLGFYGSEEDGVLVFEREGGLWILAGGPPRRLEPAGEDRWRLPYGDGGAQELRFERDASGRGVRLRLSGEILSRRRLGPEGGQLRIEPRAPVSGLIAEARRMDPPDDPGAWREPDLVEVTGVDPTVRLDIRYAGRNNFLATRFYQEPRAFLQRPAARALVRAHRALGELGYGILVYDLYRPWWVTKVFWEATPERLRWLVADPARGSRHNRGAAADVGLFRRDSGEPVEMPATYDEATPRAAADWPGGTARQRWHRALLRAALEAEGFTVYEPEWWHFDYRGWEEYPILNRSFQELEAAREEEP